MEGGGGGLGEEDPCIGYLSLLNASLGERVVTHIKQINK